MFDLLSAHACHVISSFGPTGLRMSHNNVASPASADDFDSSDINVQFIGTADTEYAFLPILEDDTYEEDEMFTVTLTVIDGTVGTTRSSADVLTVTIEDNDCKYPSLLILLLVLLFAMNISRI